MVRLHIDHELFDRFPALRVGAFLAAHLERATAASDICRAVSLRHAAPVVGCDVDALPEMTVTLRAARPLSDWFVPLGARPTDIPADAAAVVYAAGDAVVCWSFEHRGSRQTCLHTGTTRALFFSDAIEPQQAAAAADALRDLRRALSKRGATVSAPAFADTHQRDVALRFTR